MCDFREGAAMRACARLTLLAATVGLLVVASWETAAFPGITQRVSVDSAGSEANNWSWYPALSDDGRYVAFHSWASNLVPGDLGGWTDVFVHDRQTGVTERVSVDSGGNQGNDDSWYPAISADGRYVAFHSGASNLVAGDTNISADVFVHDRQTGATERVSVDSAGEQGNGDSEYAAISVDGRYVAFRSGAANLVPGDTNGARDVFVHDRQTGITERVSVGSGGSQGNGQSAGRAISSDGRYVAFDSYATNLVPADTNRTRDVFVHDRQTGATERVSVDSTGEQGNGESARPAMSADGRYVAFDSLASNLVPEDSNGVRDVFVHDRQTGATERATVDSGGDQGNNHTWYPAVSGGGRYVAFHSSASNLVPGDSNNAIDIFVRDRQAGTTERVSVDSVGNQANNYSHVPAMSADGRYVAFHSQASNLVAGDTNGNLDVFVHDRRTAGPVGGIAELPDISERHDSPALEFVALAGVSAVALALLIAGAWYAWGDASDGHFWRDRRLR